LNFLHNSACAVNVGEDGKAIWATAPANIAIIKYMGKVGLNEAVNSSISYTLDKFIVKVSLRPAPDWSWHPLNADLQLSNLQQDRFFNHAKFLAKHFNIDQSFAIGSGGNFPVNCGIASSAASFAALTAVFGYLATKNREVSMAEITSLSRVGSGSSCRSFYKGWVLWGSQVETCDSCFDDCISQVVLVDSSCKSVSSSAAHKRVSTSLLFANRANRANSRLAEVIKALNESWYNLYKLAWQDFWDMHALFHTADPAFSFITADTMFILQTIQQYWQEHKDGPLITLDAGANVHLLYRQDQQDLAKKIYDLFIDKYRVIN